jgi:hypothetical protein
MAASQPTLPLRFPIDLKAANRIQEFVDNFDACVWTQYLRDQFRAMDCRGASGSFTAYDTPHEIKVFTMAARCAITIERNDGHHVTMVAAQFGEDSRMGLQSSSLSWHEAGLLLWDVCIGCEHDIRLEPNNRLCFGCE